jgi:hypothetical protein
MVQFKQKNLNIFMIMVLNIKNPYQLVFTKNVRVNYNLGIQVIRKTLLLKKSKFIFTDCEAHLFLSMFLFTIQNIVIYFVQREIGRFKIVLN